MSKVIVNTKAIYKDFIQCELKEGNHGMKDRWCPDPAKVFLKRLRQFEYHFNSKGLWHKLMTLYYYKRYRNISLQTGISICKNCCDKGLTLYHYGSIVVNAACTIGKNCCIMNNVNIGANGGSSIAPKIGNNVYIGPGAVIYGEIEIADGCYIGANAVVNKSFLEPNSVIAGVPAKVIKQDPVNWWQKNKLNREA